MLLVVNDTARSTRPMSISGVSEGLEDAGPANNEGVGGMSNEKVPMMRAVLTCAWHYLVGELIPLYR